LAWKLNEGVCGRLGRLILVLPKPRRHSLILPA
jgi:hypothetical protein